MCEVKSVNVYRLRLSHELYWVMINGDLQAVLFQTDYLALSGLIRNVLQ